MNILEMKHVEDCLNGSVIQEVLLSKEISAEFIQILGKEGSLQYFPHFARPFFKLRIEGKLNLKGIEGNTTLRVRLEVPVEENKNLLTQLINKS
jgi:hypothetical protein